MTTFFPFHAWIEPSETSATVLLGFGGWWDADSVPVTPTSLINGGILTNGGILVKPGGPLVG